MGVGLVRPGIGIVVCLLVVAAAMFFLWIALSGLMIPDPSGGLFRALGGFIGFYAVFFVTLAAMQRS